MVAVRSWRNHMRSSILILVIAIIASGCSGVRLVIDAVPATDELTETTVMEDKGGKAKVAQIDVTGLIADAERFGVLAPGENPVSRFMEALHKAQSDADVKAVVIRINSPGGTVTASDVLFRAIERFKFESGKPVVMCMADVAASGGYYLACAGDEIIAHPTTVTGSIGVIIQTVNFSEGLKRIGVKAESITSGPNKNMGTPFEPMTPEHRELLQNLVNEFYGGFVAIVKESRPNLKSDELAMITDGRIVTGKRAIELGLVDRLGDLHDAFEAAKRRANVKEAKMVKYHRYIEYVGSPYAYAPSASPNAAQINLVQFNLASNPFGDHTGFYYLWDPSAW
jgi:protease IV